MTPVEKVATFVSIVCAALLSLGAVLRWTYRKVIRPVWNYGRERVRRANRAVDGLLGDPGKGIPSIVDRMDQQEGASRNLAAAQLVQAAELRALREAMESHVQWHPNPGGRPAAGAIKRPRRNGGGNGSSP
jgi:hypothetical protein